MNAFFPVGSTLEAASTTSGNTAHVIPTGGPMIRIARSTGAEEVYIAFGDSSVTANATSMRLISGVVEELVNPNTAKYTHFALYADALTFVNVSCGPIYQIP